MRLLAVLGAALVLASAAAGTPATGLYGVVMRSPIRPVCVAELPCSAPARGATLVFSRRGSAPTRATTSRTGAYRVSLAAGVYSVRVETRRLGRLISPSKVSVRRGAFTRVNFTIDTGIR